MADIQIRVGQFGPAKVVLHVGCGPNRLINEYPAPEWKEIRLDVDARFEPDIIGSMTDLSMIETGSVDVIYSQQNLEHLYLYEVPITLKEFRRVLKDSPESKACVEVPDIQRVAELVAQDKLDEPCFMSPVGPIRPVDILYGHAGFIEMGITSMQHRTGFTQRTLGNALLTAGFVRVDLARSAWDLFATAYVQ